MKTNNGFTMPDNVTFFPPFKKRLDELDKKEPFPPNRLLILGMNAASGLDVDAASFVETADVLVGGKRQLGYFRGHRARKIVIKDDPAAIIEPIRRALKADKSVVVLASGDPMLFGIGVMLTRELGRENVDVFPAPSSIQVALARLREPSHDVTVLSAHGRPLASIIPAALDSAKMAVLTDTENTPSALATALIAVGMEDCRAVVAERLDSADERLVETTLHALPGRRFHRLNIVLLFRDPAKVRRRFGLPDDQFETVRAQITKAEVRAVTLSKLRLAPNGVLWDIGAGCGSVSIEAGLLMPRGAVYAVERDPEQRACLERNIARHGAFNVQVVEGEAPEAVAGLPKPDSLFVGGTGGRLLDLLDALPPPFVMNIAMPDHLGLVLARFRSAEVVQVSVARSAAVGEGHRLAALNPVFVVSVPG